MDSDDEDEQRLQQDEDSKGKDTGKDKGKESADGDDKTGCETPAAPLGDPSKRVSSGTAPAVKRSSNFPFSK